MRLVVASPYVGSTFPKLLLSKPRSVSSVLITRTTLRDFAAGSSDLEAVCQTAKLGTKVRSLPRLHAKVFVFDGIRALVTSANATPSGFYRNLECGIELTDPALAWGLEQMVLSGLGAKEPPKQWSLPDLEALRKPVAALRKLRSSFETEDLSNGDDDGPQLPTEVWQGIGTEFPAWLRLVLDGVLRIPDATFDIGLVYRMCLPVAASKFPRNQFPKEKIRQQLQRLRDLGCIDFLGDGNYRKSGS
jgi:hypothetical protein